MPSNKISDNPFQRHAYSPYDETTLGLNEDMTPMDSDVQIFTGGDLHAYVNNIPVGNLESVTWSVSVEVVGNYVMGRRDARTYATGKRVIVGSLVFSQYDRHALLEGVFKLSQRLGGRAKAPTLGDLWETSTPASQLRQINFKNITTVNSVNPKEWTFDRTINAQFDAEGFSLRGVSRSEFFKQLEEQMNQTAHIVASTKLNYSDQLPPFDLTLIGVTKSGVAASCTLFGLTITQETAGFSQNDLGGNVGMSFVALGLTPWRPVGSADGFTGPGLNAHPGR